MSTLKVGGIRGVSASSDAITVANDGSCTANLSSINNGQLSGFRNLLLNGAMQHNQRVQTGTLGYYNPVTASIYTLDRWRFAVGSSFDTNSARITQDSSGPDGFSNSLKVEIFNTQTPTGSQNAGVEQKIEAQNLQGLAYGTSAAKTMTLSFYVKSFKTGTYCVQIMQEDGTKYQLHEYTINQSNTWERKTITIVGNTSDAIDNNNNIGIRVIWALCCGSSDHVAATSSWVSGGSFHATSNQVNLWDNSNNDWFLTGCQLEIGSVVTDFEHRSFGQELALCQRYFFRYLEGNTKEIGSCWYFTNSHISFFFEFPTTMRAVPTGTATTGTDYYTNYRNGAADGINSISFENGSTEQFSAFNNTQASGTAGQCGLIRSTNASAKVEFSAEL